MSNVRQLAGGGRAVEVAPARVRGWFERFVAGHGGAASTVIEPRRVRVKAHDTATASVRVPFGGLADAPGEVQGLDISALVEHVCLPRRIGIVLVRLGAHSVGIASDGKIETSSTDRHLVHGRNKAGGWSQQRFARRRTEQSRRSLAAAGDAVARVLVAERASLDGIVLGGDRQALDTLAEDNRLKSLFAAAEPAVLDMPEPRRSVLDEAAKRAVAVEIEVHDP